MQDFNPQNLRYAKLVDRYSRYIESPVLKLRFLNAALKMEPPNRWLMKLPFVGSLPERAAIIVELSKVLPVRQRAPLALRLTSLLYRMRHAVYATCAAAVLLLTVGMVYTVSRVISNLSISTEAKDTAASQPTASAGAVVQLPTQAGLPPEKIWLAEQGDGYDFYSNGARVLTEFETTGPERRFYRFSLDSIDPTTQQGEIMTTPVGIVYHVSESDLLPFTDDYNARLKNHSRALLEYARDRRLYNYLIDRFGRTYLIVRDEFAANHAGNSVWSDDLYAYVNLSAGFIGICFEGQSKAGTVIGPDAINEAQIYAARQLTALLRSKHPIPDANCVTHGLVSVNPSNRLMGYHTDWVAYFPFESVGLTNKYEMELTAISRFGFGYDQAYVAAAGGKRWPGLDRADAALASAAKRKGVTVAEERRQLARAYQRLYSLQRGLESN
jgi:hypothetical protein